MCALRAPDDATVDRVGFAVHKQVCNYDACRLSPQADQQKARAAIAALRDALEAPHTKEDYE